MVNALDMVTFKTSIYSALNINSKGKTLCLLNTVCVHLCACACLCMGVLVHVHVFVHMCSQICRCLKTCSRFGYVTPWLVFSKSITNSHKLSLVEQQSKYLAVLWESSPGAASLGPLLRAFWNHAEAEGRAGSTQRLPWGQSSLPHSPGRGWDSLPCSSRIRDSCFKTWSLMWLL